MSKREAQKRAPCFRGTDEAQRRGSQYEYINGKHSVHLSVAEKMRTLSRVYLTDDPVATQEVPPSSAFSGGCEIVHTLDESDPCFTI